MKKEEVIEIAVSVGLASFLRENDPVLMKKLEPFANAIERWTLERAAVVCEDVTEPAYYGYEDTNTFQDGTMACAAAIRALKDSE